MEHQNSTRVGQTNLDFNSPFGAYMQGDSEQITPSLWTCFLIYETKIRIECTSSGYHKEEVTTQFIYVSALNIAWNIGSAT